MQCGGGARPEWAGKRLVAVKRMKKKWEGGWDECKRLKELEVSLHDFSPHSSPHFCTRVVAPRNTIPPLHNTTLRFLSPPRYQGAIFRV
jgi:hypothetical protein